MWGHLGYLAGAQSGPTPYPVNSPEIRAQFSPHIHKIFDLGPNWACWLGPNWDPLTTQQSAQKPKFSLAHVSIPYPNWGPTVIASWGPIGAHSIPSKQPRNPSPVYPTNPHNIRRGAQQGLLDEAQLGPTPYPANSPETQAQFSPTHPRNIRRGAQLGLLAGAQLGPNPYPANSPETQAQFSPHIHAISDVGPNCAC